MASEETGGVSATDPRYARSAEARAGWIGFAWATLAVMIFSGWFVVTRFSVAPSLTECPSIAIIVLGVLLLSKSTSLSIVPIVSKT